MLQIRYYPREHYMFSVPCTLFKSSQVPPLSESVCVSVTFRVDLLRPAPPVEPGVEARVSDVVNAQHPTEEAFHPEADPAVRLSPVFPEVGVPIIRGGVDPVFVEPVEQRLEVVLPHTASDDLPDSGQQQIHRLGELLPVAAPRHIKT